jgi:hypothetical protein
MGTSDPYIFRFLKSSNSHTSMSSKIMALNIYKDIYRRSIQKKVPLKNTLYFRKYKKDKFLTKRYIILLLLYYYLLSEILLFLFPKYNVFFNMTFLHRLFLYISIYIFNIIIFGDMEYDILNFSKFQKWREHWCPCAPNPFSNKMAQNEKRPDFLVSSRFSDLVEML